MENITHYKIIAQIKGINIHLHTSDLSQEAKDLALEIAADDEHNFSSEGDYPITDLYNYNTWHFYKRKGHPLFCIEYYNCYDEKQTTLEMEKIIDENI